MDWRKVLNNVSSLLDKANKSVSRLLVHVCQLIAESAQPELIERANRAFTSEFQKYSHLIFQSLTNCEGLDLEQQGEELQMFLAAFGKISAEALQLFFSVSLTLLRYDKDDADLCKERQTMVELTANFMNLKRVKPFVDEFIANFWQDHLINTVSKFDEKKMCTLAIVLTKVAKISEISPSFKETHRKDLFHTLTAYLIQSTQSQLVDNSEIVVFESIEEIEMVVWLMKIFSLISSCGNSNISGTNSTVRGVEERVRKQLKINLKVVDKLTTIVVGQRVNRKNDNLSETRYRAAFYELLDRLSRCLIFGPYFLKAPRGLLSQGQIDSLIDSFERLTLLFSDPKKDKDKIIQAIFERTVLHASLLGLYSNTKKSPNTPDPNHSRLFKKRKIYSLQCISRRKHNPISAKSRKQNVVAGDHH